MAKLMLVEDDNNLREIYQARLQAEGYTIVSAKDGEEALVLAKAEKPDLIIADIMMPKISGFEMLDILRNTDGLKEVKVIMLTALGQSDDQQRANQLGADRYLVKSQVTLEDIVKVTHELLGDQQPASAAAATPAAPQPEPTSEPGAKSAPESTSEPVTEPEPAEPNPAASAAATTIPVTAEPSEQASSPDATTETDSLAQSTAQEEAAADGRIEDFVAGATEEATPPAAPAQTPVAATAAADDDKLVADAAQKLVDSTEDAEAAKPSTPAIAKADKPDKPDTDTAKPDTDDAAPTHRTGKVIKPLDDKPKQDIDTLLAVEEAKEAGTNPAPPTPVVVTDDSAGQVETSTQSPIIKPSSTVAPDSNKTAP